MGIPVAHATSQICYVNHDCFVLSMIHNMPSCYAAGAERVLSKKEESHELTFNAVSVIK